MKRFISIWCLLFLSTVVVVADENVKVGREITLWNSTRYIANRMSVDANWSSNNSCAQIVSSNDYSCTVRGVNKGSAKITCSWKCQIKVYGGSPITKTGTDTFYVTVESNDPEEVDVYPSSLELSVGESSTLSASVYPSDAEYSSITWSSSNSSAAQITGNGSSATVKALQATTSPVTIKAAVSSSCYGTCKLTIYGTNPTALSLSNPGTLIAEGSGAQINATFTPSNHRSAITWSSSEPQVARVNSSGYVTPQNPGKTTITARTANGLTATTTVEVREPSFTVTGSSPTNNSSDVDVLTSCSVTFSLPIHLSSNISDAKLTGGGSQVKGQLTYSGNTVTFIPEKALSPHTNYTWVIPKGVVLNKWDTSSPAFQLTFTTGALRPMSLSCSLSEGFVFSGETAVLKASEAGAAIYYTLDGSTPTEKSTLYQNPIVIDKNVILKARAFKNGYETPEIKAEYKLSTIRVAQKYPLEDEFLYLYKDVNPFVEYNFDVKKGPHFNDCKVTTPNGKTIKGTFILCGRYLTFVPSNPLPMGQAYTVTIPNGAVMLHMNDQSKAMEWTFVSGLFYRNISAGYDHNYAIRTDNILYCWGEYATSVSDNYDYNSTFYSDNAIDIATNVMSASCGMTHSLFTTFDGNLYGRGRQYSGELGNGAVFSVVDNPTLIQKNVTMFTAGAQTSVFLQNSELKGAGKNDFNQIKEGSNVYLSNFGKLDASVPNLKSIECGFGNFYAITTSGALYGWGDNSYGQLLNSTKGVEEKAVLIMEAIDTVASSKWRAGFVAVIKKDHTLWTWGNNCYGQLGNGTFNDGDEPVKVMDDVVKVAVGDYCMAAINSKNELWMWGYNASGQLGLGHTTNVNTPQKVCDDITDISLGHESAIALDLDGNVYRWGLIRTGGADQNNTTPVLFLKGRSSKTITSTTIVNTSIVMTPGSKAVVCAKPVPLQADYHEWSWSTSNAEVATVDERGVVTAVSQGTAIITLTSDNGKTAQCTVTVGDSFIPGDVNSDGLVNVTDIVATVNYIMEKPSDNFNEAAADLNGDGEINVTDIVKMVSIIMSGDGGSSRRAAATSSHLVISRNNIQLRNAEAYIAAQFDINLSDGESISNVVFNGSSNHRLHWKMVDANTYRVVVYSMTNAAFRVNSDNLIDIFMNGSQKATISNEILIKADGTTGIDAIRKDAEDGKVYDLNGRQVKNPRKGVYIINGKKVLVK